MQKQLKVCELLPLHDPLQQTCTLLRSSSLQLQRSTHCNYLGLAV